jgi:GNAT superfamily N-acetyltransferase
MSRRPGRPAASRYAFRKLNARSRFRVESIKWRRHERTAEFSSEVVSAITELLRRAYAPLGAAGLNYSAVNQSEARTLERLRHGVSLIGMTGEHIVATGTLNLGPVHGRCVTYRSEDTAHFEQFAVEPELQGTGIGGSLLSKLELIAKDCGKAFIAGDTAAPARSLVTYYH